MAWPNTARALASTAGWARTVSATESRKVQMRVKASVAVPSSSSPIHIGIPCETVVRSRLSASLAHSPTSRSSFCCAVSVGTTAGPATGASGKAASRKARRNWLHALPNAASKFPSLRAGLNVATRSARACRVGLNMPCVHTMVSASNSRFSWIALAISIPSEDEPTNRRGSREALFTWILFREYGGGFHSR